MRVSLLREPDRHIEGRYEQYPDTSAVSRSCYNSQNENIIYTDNKDIISDKNIGDVTFTNIECSFDGFNSLLTYTITNNSKNNIILGNYELIVKDKDDNILAIMVPGDTKELKPTETIDIENVINIDLTKASKLELNLSK